MQDPIGFWDPLGGAYYIKMHPHASTFLQQAGYDLLALAGLSADKDEATFKRRRAVEIKHGRIVADSGEIGQQPSTWDQGVTALPYFCHDSCGVPAVAREPCRLIGAGHPFC